MSRYIIDIHSRAARDPRRSGGKGAGLSRLAAQGFDVPPGFVITTAAHRGFVAGLKPQDRPAATSQPQALSDAVLAAPIPSAIRDAILRAYAPMGGRVAVRSSAVVEDGGEASHAGQFRTLLNITGEDALLDAVRACWASLSAERATSYLAQQGVAADDGMAVVVQRMVPAVAAGVAFSADPISGQPCVIIEAAPGLGSAVVEGGCPVDRYVVDERGVLAEVAPVDATRPVLQPAQILGLAGLVTEIAGRASSPQDVEWAWDGVAVRILQARPITALQQRHVYSRALVSDMAPGLVKPMVYDVNTLATVREIFGPLFSALLGVKGVDPSRLVMKAHSRVYADMTVLGGMLEAAGLPPNLFEVMLRDERSTKPRMPMSPRLLGITARMIRLVLRSGRLTEAGANLLRSGHGNLAPFRARDWSGLPLPDLLAELDNLIALRDRLFWFYFCGVFNSAARSKVLRAWVERNASGVEFGDLIRGLTKLKSLEPSLELIGLAKLAEGFDDEILAALSDADDASLRRLLGATEQGQKLLSGVDAFLVRHGYLSSNGSDFSSPSWTEHPALIWRSIARSLVSGQAGQAQSAAAIRAEAEDRVRASVGPMGRWVFGRLMAAATTAIDRREQASVLISEYNYEMRRLFRAAGQQLAEQGRLAEIEDLFYLEYRELQDLAAGHLDPAVAAACIRVRRATAAADAAFDPPETIIGVPGQAVRTLSPARYTDGATCLRGIGGSPGLVRGLARVVHDPMDAPATLGRTDILVVPFSDVGWTPLFSGIGGIVAETGGQLSHAAIVAREYNLPAVVSVRDATRRICDGQMLTVDGCQGHVYLEPPVV